MVHVITPANRYLYNDMMDKMFVMRWFVAIKELGWTLPDASNEFDKDAYDHDETIYFIDLDQDKNVIGTARLNPTLRPHLLSDIFPQLCNLNGVPKGKTVYEYSRFLVKKTGVPRREYARSQAHISLSVAEYCLAAGITQLSWVTYKRSYPLALRMWKTEPLGLPQYFESDEADYIAGISHMGAESLERTRRLAQISQPVCHITVPLELVPELAQLSASPAQTL